MSGGHAGERALDLDALELGPVPGPIRGGLTAAPEGCFDLELRSPHLGTITLTSASLEGRLTLVLIRLTPDGEVDVSQHLLRLPGRTYPEPAPEIPLHRQVRELLLAQKVAQSGELLAAAERSPAVRNLVTGEWTDPVVGCMVLHALLASPPRLRERWSGAADGLLSNLERFFGEFADVRVAASMRRSHPGPLDDLLAAGRVPMLAQSARVLAERAVARDGPSAPLRDRLRRVPPRSPWMVSVEAP